MGYVSFEQLDPAFAVLDPPVELGAHCLGLDRELLGRMAARRGLGPVGLGESQVDILPGIYFDGFNDEDARLSLKGHDKQWAGWAIVDRSAHTKTAAALFMLNTDGIHHYVSRFVAEPYDDLPSTVALWAKAYNDAVHQALWHGAARRRFDAERHERLLMSFAAIRIGRPIIKALQVT